MLKNLGKKNVEYSMIRTLDIINRIHGHAKNRNDDWGSEVLVRVSCVSDLIAVEGRYHRNCYNYFFRPNSSKPGTAQLQGFKADGDQSKAFQKLCEYLEENDECQYSIEELMSIMGRIESKDSSYSKKTLEKKTERTFW